MREDRLNWASGLETHAKRMFDATKNPYYVVAAIAAARTAEWAIPKWALDALTQAVAAAWWESQVPGGEMSVDKTLGLRTKRGGTPVAKSASRASIEDGVFALVKTIHTCFEVSIPVACEVAYLAIDFEYAKGAEEWLPPPGEPVYSEDDLKKIGLSRAELLDVGEKERARTRRIIEKDSNTAAVKKKLYAYEHWTITHGDRLGYSLDKFIDRYYREGGKILVPHGNLSERKMLIFEGCFLLLIDERCTHHVRVVRGEEDPVRGKSAVAGFPRREEFADFAKDFPGLSDRK